MIQSLMYLAQGLGNRAVSGLCGDQISSGLILQAFFCILTHR